MAVDHDFEHEPLTGIDPQEWPEPMTAKKPFTLRQRRRMSHQNGFGARPRNNWWSGDLPAPFAEGDVVRLVGERPDRVDVGETGDFYVVCSGFSIDEGDAWYFRVTMTGEDVSDRLHVFPDGENWMAPFELVETSDPAGLAKRERLLAAGWTSWAKKGETGMSRLEVVTDTGLTIVSGDSDYTAEEERQASNGLAEVLGESGGGHVTVDTPDGWVVIPKSRVVCVRFVRGEAS